MIFSKHLLITMILTIKKQKGVKMAAIRYSIKCMSFMDTKSIFVVDGSLEDTEKERVIDIFSGNVMITFDELHSIYYCDAEYEMLANMIPPEGIQESEEEKLHTTSVMLEYIQSSIFAAIKRLYFLCPGGTLAKIRYKILGLNNFDETIVKTTSVALRRVDASMSNITNIPVT